MTQTHLVLLYLWGAQISSIYCTGPEKERACMYANKLRIENPETTLEWWCVLLGRCFFTFTQYRYQSGAEWWWDKR